MVRQCRLATAAAGGRMDLSAMGLIKGAIDQVTHRRRVRAVFIGAMVIFAPLPVFATDHSGIYTGGIIDVKVDHTNDNKCSIVNLQDKSAPPFQINGKLVTFYWLGNYSAPHLYTGEVEDGSKDRTRDGIFTIIDTQDGSERFTGRILNDVVVDFKHPVPNGSCTLFINRVTKQIGVQPTTAYGPR
jgi:hypothetical protein